MTAFFANSHAGHKREHNEDCYEADPKRGLWLVADGVGGHASGEVASAIVRDTLVHDIGEGGSLIEAIHHSHSEILREIASGPASNMGSTVVALQLLGDEFEVAWVGDSRAYLFDGASLRQLTRDHNPVSEMLARGAITPEQAAHHPERNVLSQSLGVSDNVDVKPERLRGEWHPGQQILLCSDGLTDELSDSQILATLLANDTPATQVNALIKGALEAGGRDNVTVIVVGEKGDRPAEGARAEEQQAGPAGHGHSSHDRLVWAILAGMVVVLVLLWLFL